MFLACCGDSIEAGPTLIAADSTGADSLSAGDGTGSPGDGSSKDASPAGTCKTSGECAAPNPVCDPLAKQCVQCLFDSDCSSGQLCDHKVCAAAVACQNSLDCANARSPTGLALPICDASLAKCVECSADSDCPEHNTCEGHACKPYTPCGNSIDCGNDRVCDTDKGRCVQCLGDNDCAKDQLCEVGVCKAYVACASDKQCTPLGLLCDTKLGKCGQCKQHSDCPEVYHCAPTGVSGTGQCVLDTCAAGKGACAGNAKILCTSVGDGYGTPEPCPGATTCVGGGGKPTCKPWQCQPGLHCQGNALVDCSADGFEVLSSKSCAQGGQLCVVDSCQDAVCTPGALLCQGNTVAKCGADGQSTSAVQPCLYNQFCQDGACEPQVCTPGKPACDGNVVKTCNSYGSGYASGAGKDCGDLKCISGLCKAPSCTPNQTYCQGNKLLVCAADGYSGKLVKDCGAGATCQAGTCKPLICEPYQVVCVGNVAKQCNATGTEYNGPGIDCATGKCVNGTCKNLACAPGSQYCENGTAKTCSPDGLKIAIEKVCASGTYCAVTASGTADCLPTKCSPGAVSCSGNTAVTCNSDGSGYLPGGTDCSSKGQVCASGVCASLQCDPKNLLYCAGNVVMMCDSSGLKPVVIQTCGSQEVCNNGTCFVKVCTPGAPACSGDFATTCNATGDGYVGAKTDCKAQGKVCSGGKCG